MIDRTRLGAMLVVAAMALAACSGSAATPGAATVAPATQAATPASQAPATAPASAPASASAAVACTVGSGSAATTAEIRNFAFPAGLTVKAGGSITFTNADSAPHTVTMEDGSCDAGRISSGSSATITFTAPGTYAFHCAIHTSMKGTVVVTG